MFVCSVIDVGIFYVINFSSYLTKEVQYFLRKIYSNVRFLVNKSSSYLKLVCQCVFNPFFLKKKKKKKKIVPKILINHIFIIIFFDEIFIIKFNHFSHLYIFLFLSVNYFLGKLKITPLQFGGDWILHFGISKFRIYPLKFRMFEFYTLMFQNLNYFHHLKFRVV